MIAGAPEQRARVFCSGEHRAVPSLGPLIGTPGGSTVGEGSYPEGLDVCWTHDAWHGGYTLLQAIATSPTTAQHAYILMSAMTKMIPLKLIELLAQLNTSRDYVLAEPKTPYPRHKIALPQQAVAALRAHRVEQNKERLALGPAWDTSVDLVFPNVIGWLRSLSVILRHRAILHEGNPVPDPRRPGSVGEAAVRFQLANKGASGERKALLTILCPTFIGTPEVPSTVPGAWVQFTAGGEKPLQGIVVRGCILGGSWKSA